MRRKEEQNARILHYVCPKKIFSGIFGGAVGECNPLAPVSYAYDWAPGPPPAKSGPDFWRVAINVHSAAFAIV